MPMSFCQARPMVGATAGFHDKDCTRGHVFDKSNEILALETFIFADGFVIFKLNDLKNIFCNIGTDNSTMFHCMGSSFWVLSPSSLAAWEVESIHRTCIAWRNLLLSFQRRLESIPAKHWMPACAGMTVL